MCQVFDSFELFVTLYRTIILKKVCVCLIDVYQAFDIGDYYSFWDSRSVVVLISLNGVAVVVRVCFQGICDFRFKFCKYELLFGSTADK